MEEKQKKLKAKVINKHETEADWLLSQYVPDIGEVVFYDPDERYSYTRQKNGDGIHRVSELPFATEAQVQADWAQTDETKADFIKNKPENLVYSEDSELGDATLPEGGNVAFSPEDAGKFLIVGEDGKIAVSPVSVGSPIVVTSAETMDAILANATEADIGKVYLYKGETTENYENGALYGIEAE